MPVLSPAAVYDIAQRHFGDLGEDVVRTMAAIAMGESGGDTAIANTKGRDRSHGLWQINIHPDANPDLDVYDLTDPEQNAQAARIILDRQGLGAWSVYTKGTYKKHLPQFGQQMKGTAKADTMPAEANMTSQSQGTDVVTGSSVLDQILEYLNNTATHTYNASNLAGWMDPAMLGLGGSTMLPTLAREQWEQERKDADRDYALDVAQFGLEQARFNYEQRVAAADAKYKELSLLASQRGPADSIAYNYALRGLSAPEGTQVNPHQTSQGINQPSNIQIPSGGGGNVSPAPPPPPPPTAPQTSGFGSIAPISNPATGNVYQPTLGADGQTVTFAGPDGNWQMVNGEFVKTGGGGASTSTPAAPSTARTASTPMPTIGDLPVDQRQAFRDVSAPRSTIGDLPVDQRQAFRSVEQQSSPAIIAPAQASQAQASQAQSSPAPSAVPSGQAAATGHAGMQANAAKGIASAYDASGQQWQMVNGQFVKMAQGGVAGGGTPDGRILMLGDEASGQPTGNEELLLNPTNAPVGVVPNEAIPPGVAERAQSGGTPSAEEVLQIIGQLIASMDFGGEQSPPMRELGDLTNSAEPVAAAGGGIFGNTVYTGEEIAGMPALQAMAGNTSLPAFGATGLNMTIPGSDTTLPMGHQASLQQYMRMHDSERKQLQGAIETPREMGGLGLVWGDWLEGMLRAAPTGQAFGAASYG